MQRIGWNRISIKRLESQLFRQTTEIWKHLFWKISQASCLRLTHTIVFIKLAMTALNLIFLSKNGNIQKCLSLLRWQAVIWC